MQFKALRGAAASLFIAALAACGGGGGGSTTSSGTSIATPLTVAGTAATGLAIPGAIVTGKCKVGTGTATTLADGSYTLTITDGQLPCVLQITNPVDGIKLHTVVTGTGSTATANITPLTEMVTARVLGSEPKVYFAAFDAAVAVQKITSTTVQAAQTDIGLVLTGTVDTTALGNFISAPLKAATHDSLTTGDAHDKLLDALKLKLTAAQIGTLATALAGSQTTDAIKQTVASMTTAPTTQPNSSAGAGTLEILISATAPNDNLLASLATLSTTASNTFCGYQVGTQRLSGVVTAVHDGDTITIGGQSVRLDSIDAPELKQTYGAQAQQALSSRLLGKTVTVAFTKKDKYGRIVGAVFTSSCEYVNLDMVSAGAAWFYRAYQCEVSATTRSALNSAEATAQASDRGLWAGNATAPWVYRNGVEANVPSCSNDMPTWEGNPVASIVTVPTTPTPTPTPTTSGSGSSSYVSPACSRVWVKGYRRSNGTYVSGYWRASPGCA